MSNDKKCQDLFSLSEISRHNEPESCWVVYKDEVYDLTYFIEKHPGGMENILEYAGCDITWVFLEKGHSHFAETLLNEFCIGQLIPEERSYHHWEKLLGEEKMFKEV